MMIYVRLLNRSHKHGQILRSVHHVVLLAVMFMDVSLSQPTRLRVGKFNWHADITHHQAQQLPAAVTPASSNSEEKNHKIANGERNCLFSIVARSPRSGDLFAAGRVTSRLCKGYITSRTIPCHAHSTTRFLFQPHIGGGYSPRIIVEWKENTITHTSRHKAYHVLMQWVD